MKLILKVLFVCFMMVLICCAPVIAVEPLDLHWDLSDWREVTENEVVVTTSENGLTIKVRKANWCDRRYDELPSKARYLSKFKATAEVESLEGGSCGLFLSNGKVSIVLNVSKTESELRCAASGQVSLVKSAKIKPVNFPATISLAYDTTTGIIEGFLNGEKIIEGNADTLTNMPKISSIRYVGVISCSNWNQTFSTSTYSTLNLEAR